MCLRDRGQAGARKWVRYLQTCNDVDITIVLRSRDNSLNLTDTESNSFCTSACMEAKIKTLKGGPNDVKKKNSLCFPYVVIRGRGSLRTAWPWLVVWLLNYVLEGMWKEAGLGLIWSNIRASARRYWEKTRRKSFEHNKMVCSNSLYGVRYEVSQRHLRGVPSVWCSDILKEGRYIFTGVYRIQPLLTFTISGLSWKPLLNYNNIFLGIILKTTFRRQESFSVLR